MVIALAAVLVALDQLSKAWIVRTLPTGGQEIPLALGFRFVHTRNNGAAFGILRNLDLHVGPWQVDGTLLLGLLSLAVSVVLLVYLLRNGAKLRVLPRIAVGVVLAGAVGNMIDRLRLGYVVDFIHFKVGSFDFPVFNVADASVVVGAALLLLSGLLVPDPEAGNHHPSDDEPVSRHASVPEMPEIPPLRSSEESGSKGFPADRPSVGR